MTTAKKTETDATKPATKTSGRGNSKAREVGRRGRPVDADSAATRRAIIDAAADVFGSHGYQGTSMQMIAKDAGITAPTLYHYFPSKADIFREVGDQVSAEFRRRTDAVVADAPTTTLQFAAVLRALGDWITERPEIGSFIAMYAAEVARNREVRRLSPEARWTEPMEYYAQFARDGLDRGEIADDLDPATVAGLVQGLVYGMSALVGVGRAFGPPDRVIDAFVRLIEGTVFVDP